MAIAPVVDWWPGDDPVAALEFAAALEEGETLAAVTWTLPTDLTMPFEQIAGSQIRFRLAGLAWGGRYVLYAVATTSLNNAVSAELPIFVPANPTERWGADVRHGL